MTFVLIIYSRDLTKNTKFNYLVNTSEFINVQMEIVIRESSCRD